MELKELLKQRMSLMSQVCKLNTKLFELDCKVNLLELKKLNIQQEFPKLNISESLFCRFIGIDHRKVSPVLRDVNYPMANFQRKETFRKVVLGILILKEVDNPEKFVSAYIGVRYISPSDRTKLRIIRNQTRKFWDNKGDFERKQFYDKICGIAMNYGLTKLCHLSELIKIPEKDLHEFSQNMRLQTEDFLLFAQRADELYEGNANVINRVNKILNKEYSELNK